MAKRNDVDPDVEIIEKKNEALRDLLRVGLAVEKAEELDVLKMEAAAQARTIERLKRIQNGQPFADLYEAYRRRSYAK